MPEQSTADLRTLAAEAEKARVNLAALESEWLQQCGPCDYGLNQVGCSHPEGDYRPVMVRLVREIEALRRLAAVLPAHRAEVLAEAADELASEGECDCGQREKNLPLPRDERTHEHACSFWPDEEAAAAVRRLAATGPTTGPTPRQSDEQPPVLPVPPNEGPDGHSGSQGDEQPIGSLVHLASYYGVYERVDRGWIDINNAGGGRGIEWDTLIRLNSGNIPVRLVPAVDCGHDLDAFARQEGELAQARADVERLGRERDEAHQLIAEMHEDVQKLSDTVDELNDERAAAETERDHLAEVAWKLTVQLDEVAATARRYEADRDEARLRYHRLADHDALRGEALDKVIAERDRLADTVRRQQPVIDAAKAWRQMRLGTPTQPKPEAFALIIAVDALGDAGQDDDYRCTCDPNDLFDPPDPRPRAVAGCPAHRARRAAQQFIEQSVAEDAGQVPAVGESGSNEGDGNG